MAFEWHYDDDPASVTHLDDVFAKGNAPALAGMLRSLANFDTVGTWTPRYLDIHKIQILAGDDGEYRSHSYELVKAHEIFCDEYSILQGSARSDPLPDLHFDQFFLHADVVSGQDVGAGEFAESLVDRTEAARMGQSHDEWFFLLKSFNSNNGELWSQWTDKAGQKAKEKFELAEFWHGTDDDSDYRQNRLLKLTDLTVQFAATIHAARANLDYLMGEAVRQVHAWNASAPGPGEESVLWVAISSIAGLASSAPAKSPVKSAIDFANALNDVITAAKGNAPSLGGHGCYGILNEYLRQADQVLDEASEKAEALSAELATVRDGIPDVPQWKG